MTRRRRVIAGTAFLLLLTGVSVVLFNKTSEPSFNGRQLSEWLQDITPTTLTRTGPTAIWWTAPQRVRDHAGDIIVVQTRSPGIPVFVSGPFGPTREYPTQHIAAAQAIRGIGTNAIPPLLRRLYSQDSLWKTRLATLWRKQRYVKLPFQTAIEKRERALPALRELGPTVVWTWVEILTNRLATIEVRQYAAGSLAEMREGAIPALATLLELQDHSNQTMRASVGAAIQYCDNEGFLSALYNVRRSSDAAVRAGGAWSLGFIRKNPDKSIPALATAADDMSPWVRESAIEALAKFNDVAKVRDIIIRALSDSKLRVRRAATNALDQLRSLDMQSLDKV